MAKDGSEDVRMWVFRGFFLIFSGESKLFSFPIYVTSKRKKAPFVSQQNVSLNGTKDATHSHHNFDFQEFFSPFFSCPEKCSHPSFPWQWFWHWNKRKSGFLSCVRPSPRYTHTSLIERFTNIGKKYEIIKILDVWYWFLLIFHYEGPWVGWGVCGWAKILPFFFASAYISRLLYANGNPGRRTRLVEWDERFNFSAVRNMKHTMANISTMEKRKIHKNLIRNWII